MIADSGERTTYDNGEWKPVVGYEGLYEVSNYGRVKSKYTSTRITDTKNKIMKQKYDTRGYFRVNLTKNGKQKNLLVSRLVAMAFVPNPKNLPMVGHDDDNKENNHVSNLYWTDAAENTAHNGLRERFFEKRRAKMPQIIEKLSEPVIGTNVETGEEIRFKSMQEAQRNGFQSGKISMCCAGKRETHKGYRWRKENDNRQRKQNCI